MITTELARSLVQVSFKFILIACFLTAFCVCFACDPYRCFRRGAHVRAQRNWRSEGRQGLAQEPHGRRREAHAFQRDQHPQGHRKSHQSIQAMNTHSHFVSSSSFDRHLAYLRRQLSDRTTQTSSRCTSSSKMRSATTSSPRSAKVESSSTRSCSAASSARETVPSS